MTNDHGSGKPRKASVEYNLEKDPLQTGLEVSSVDLRERVAGSGGPWAARRRMAGLLMVMITLIILGVGLWAAIYLQDFWTAFFAE